MPKGDECTFFRQLSLNIIDNFMEWNLTDSREILETLILTRCLYLVQIPLRLASLLQKHSPKSVGHFVTKLIGKSMHAKVMTVF